MNKKKMAVVCFLMILPILGLWQYDNLDYGETNYFTKYQKVERIKTVDELFGTETIQVKRENGFWLGLFPNDDSFSINLFVGVVPIGAFLSLISIGLLISDRKSKKK